MHIGLLNALETVIRNGDYKPDGPVIVGANLIVSKNPARHRHNDDEFDFSPYAEEISRVIFELKSVFEDEIDYLIKLGFYPALGRAANKAIQSNSELQAIQQAIVDEVKDFWSNRPQQS